MIQVILLTDFMLKILVNIQTSLTYIFRTRWDCGTGKSLTNFLKIHIGYIWESCYLSILTVTGDYHD